ncbi:MAG: VOC family protein [Leptolyngbya sp. PLA1]|nr:VOC family protein [Leptolyngbya sp. PLA1]
MATDSLPAPWSRGRLVVRRGRVSKAHARTDYLELSVRDAARSKEFYAAAFGWTFQDYGPGYIGFNDGTGESGGMRVEAEPAPPLAVLYAEDLDAVKARVVAAGGTLAGPEIEFPGGRRFHFRDPSGNELAVWTRA